MDDGRVARDVERDRVALAKECLGGVGDFGPVLGGDVGDVGAGVIDEQASLSTQKGHGALGHLLADAPAAVQAEGGVLGLIGADDGEVAPMGAMIEGIDPLEGGHPLGNGVFGDRVGMDRRHRDDHPVPRGCWDIDLVETDAPAGDDTQFFGGRVKFVRID